MSSVAVIHASQLVTLAGPKRPRVGAEMSELGIIRDGGKVIWCNFFPVAGKGKDEFQNWRKERIVVDDGGFFYWQIEYDPEADKCSRFYSNGYA